MAKRSGQKKTTRRPKATRPRRRTVSTPRAKALTPQRATRRREPVTEPPDEGPAGWFLPQIESTYTRLAPADQPRPLAAPRARARGARSFTSVLQPGAGEEVLEQPAPTVWLDRLAEYKQRKAVVAIPRAAPAAPAVPGAVNWMPLGPSVVMNAQTVGNESVGGRVVGLAIAPGGEILYAASACGGVFRSDDGGASWRSLMDGFDTDPTNFAAASLACGAIAIDPGDQSRVYVGTGEGETHEIFRSRIVNALPAYRGIGPIRTDDGGDTWVTERTAAGSKELAGEAFFALAVDPGQRENVVAATTAGLYQRTIRVDGTVEWVSRRAGVHSSVIAAASGGASRFFAAEWGNGVWTSTDGQTWSAAGTGFPTNGVGRISLAAQATDPNVVYALVAVQDTGVLHGVYRLDMSEGIWKQIANPPNVLPVSDGRSQGDYDLAIAVDPNAINRVYLGGSYAEVDPFPASVWRADVQATGTTWRFANAASIGTHAHADVHVLVVTPDDSDELWCGCDGGVFLNRDPSGTGEFASQNSGIACLCCNFIAQHPTDPHVLFTGLQDNGTARTPGGPIWSHVNYGDGGYCLINWADPQQVLSFVNGQVYRSASGGATHQSWELFWKFPWATMTQPIVGVPFNPATPADANIVAVGAGTMVFVSDDFAKSWPKDGQLSLPGGNAAGSAFALAFASANRFYVGTTAGRVFRADRKNQKWTLTRLDTVVAGALGVRGLITDVAIDWSDASLASIYICFGGMGDRRRVWRFDGSRWEARSGPAGGETLLDVEHNAIVVDRASAQNLYVGADIGVWHSADQGASWRPLQNGLPDAPVFDLQIHPTRRLLRAATYGRGVYELALS
jgi:hypothetical protein